MLRRKRTQISITLVMAIVLIAQAIPAQKAACLTESLRDVTPDNPLIFCQLTGLSSIVNTESNFWNQVAQAPFWELVYAELEARSKVKEVQLAIEPGVSLLSYIFGEDIVFVLPRFGQITEVSPLLMLRLKDGEDALGKIIANSIKAALANVAKTTSEYGGYEIATIPLPEGVPFGLSGALLGDVFAVGLGDVTLKKVIDLINGSEGAKAIAKDAEFSSIMERLPLPEDSETGQYLGVLHVDLARIVAFGNAMYPMVRENIPAAPRLIVEEALKLLDLAPTLTSAVSITDEGVISQGYMALNADASSQSLLQMLQVEPAVLGSMQFVPEDVVGYSGTNLIDLKLIWKTVKDTMSGMPQIGEGILGKLEQTQQELGFNFEESLISWMGDEMGYIYNENLTISGERVSEEVCWIIKVTDREKALQGLQAFTDLGVKLSEGELSVEAREYAGETIHELGNLPVPIRPGYALVGDYLLISMSTDYIQKLIDCAKGRSKGLEANPRFQAVKARLPEKVNSMEFLDIRRLVEVTIDDGKAQMEQQMPTWEGEEANLGRTVALQAFELASVLSQAFGASIGFTVNDGTGLKSNSFVQIKDLETVIPIADPDEARIARNLHIANVYREAEMLDRAASRYMKVLELDEDNWQAAMGAAHIFREQGKAQQAEKYWARTGFAPEDVWYVIGPFDNESGEGLYTEYPPEEVVSLETEYESKAGTVKWEKRADGTPDGFVDFQEIFEPDQWSVAYAWTRVVSKETREVEIRVGSDDQVVVWFNGEEVIYHEVPRAAQPDQNIISVTLNQGENQLLVKVCNEEMDWGFYLRFTDASGKPLKDLEFGGSQSKTE